jgi:hypothetical protein
VEHKTAGDCVVVKGKLTAEQKVWSRWLEALEEYDYDGDKKRLCQLLRSDIELFPLMREYLAELIECRCVPLPKGRRRTLAYRWPDKVFDHWLAHQDVKRFRRQGMSEAEALQNAAEVNGLTVTALKLSRTGHHRSFFESQRQDLRRKHSKKKC